MVILDCLAQIQKGCFDDKDRKKIKDTLIKNPITKLQVIDGKERALLYNRQKDGIALHGADLFKAHYGTVSHLTKTAFLDYVLSLNANQLVADDPKAVWQFLFTHY